MATPNVEALRTSSSCICQPDAQQSGHPARPITFNRRGQHWADPLKVWGDVLMNQGKTKDALAKYDEALKYAPNWEQLKEARETLAKQKT